MRFGSVVAVCTLAAMAAVANRPAYSQTSLSQAPERSANARRVVRFNVPVGTLADALTAISAQSGWQIVYDPQAAEDVRVGEIARSATVGAVLDQALSGSRLTWSYLNDNTIAVRLPTPRHAEASVQTASPAPESANINSDGVAEFSGLEVVTDAPRTHANELSASTFGFNKPLIATPRSITVIDEGAIDRFELSAIEDLVRVVPGVFTTTRFGIQGSVDIRNVPADTYFRGMKRLTLQGHGRSVLAAMDTIEVVGGPASPLFGMGKIGGYTNMTPKSGRAKTGGYLTETQGFTQIGFGDYRRNQFSAGLGGPIDFLRRIDKRGGYYLYALLEDSESYADGVPVRQRILQAAINVDEFFGGGRLETGASYQYSETAGALTGRLTQDLVDRGRYIRGVPLINLDLNNNGRIGYLEMQRASPVQGALSVTNQPLMQTWLWPRDANGAPLPLEQFPKVTGIPQSLYDYLAANPHADPTGLLRAQGAGGPQPLSGFVPLGMALDPRTTGFGAMNFQRAAAYERELQADFLTLFADLIWDADPDLTFKNQVFFDGMDQYKTSNQPYSTTQTVFVWEDKFTVGKRFKRLPDWLSVNGLLSINYRNTVSLGKSLFGDFSTHRTDALSSDWIADQGGMTPNTTFNNGYDNPDLYNDGYPWGGIYRTEFSEYGVGALFDIAVARNTHVLLGRRFDRSRAKNVDYAGSFNAVAGASDNPGRFAASDVRARKWDGGASWSVSVSQALPGGVHPYVTRAESSIVLDGNNNMLSNAVINNGHVGGASLTEAGVKVSALNAKLYATLAAYDQRRIDVDATDDASILNAYASATRTRGVEFQATLALQRLQVALYGLKQRTLYTPNVGGSLLVDARMLGFQDVTDAQGNVIYPAEAFLYGGRSRILLPADMSAYRKKQGNPDAQAGVNVTYRFKYGIVGVASGNYFSKTCSGRLCWVELPESYVFNAGIAWTHDDWLLKCDVFNLTDETYFRARTGDLLGDVLAQAMPGRHWQASIKKSFR